MPKNIGKGGFYLNLKPNLLAVQFTYKAPSASTVSLLRMSASNYNLGGKKLRYQGGCKIPCLSNE